MKKLLTLRITPFSPFPPKWEITARIFASHWTSSEKTFFSSTLQKAQCRGRNSMGVTVTGPQYFPFPCTHSATQGTAQPTPETSLPPCSWSTGLQLHRWTLTSQGSPYQSDDSEAEGWTKDIMMKLQWRPCQVQGLSLTSLCHSGYKLQGICIWPDTFSDDTSLKSFLLHQCQTSALLFHIMFFQRQGFY